MQAVATSHLKISAHAVARWVRLLLGLWVFACGLALMLQANLGLSSWDVLHDAIADATLLTFGQTIIGVSVVVVVGSLALGVRPGPGTVANVVLIGLFTDLIVSTQVLAPVSSNGLARGSALMVGIGAIGFGTALYIGAALGAGPRDSLMLGVAERFRTSPGAARTAIELSVLLVGAALGGAVGTGTLIFAVVIGPAINVSFRILRMPVAQRGQSATFTRSADLIRRWLRRGQLGPPSSNAKSRYTGGRI